MNSKDFAGEAVRHLGALYNYAYRLARSKEEAEELVQSTYARALGNIEKFPDRQSVRPILFRTLHNLFVNHWIARSRRPQMISMDENAMHAVGSMRSLLGDPAMVVTNALSDEVEAAFMELEESWRDILWLRAVEGFSYEEIADITKTPIGTVRSRLSRGRRLLAKSLKAYVRERRILRNKRETGGIP
jgi:RNA polymerase sigma-70 factor (ECF subfamily)